MIDQQLREAADELRTATAELVPPSEHPRSNIGPLLAIAAIIVLVLAVGSVGPLFPSRGALPVAPATSSSSPVATAAFISESGIITVIGSDGAVTGVDVAAGIPILGDTTIPDPRWTFDGRVIEYVADKEGTVQVVRVDVQTGRVAIQPYWVVSMADGGVSTSVDDEGRLMGRISLMSGGDSTSVTAVGQSPTIEWRLTSPSLNDQASFFDREGVRFLAPAPEGLLTVLNGEIGILDALGEFSSLEAVGVSHDDISAAAFAPGPSPVFGLEDGRIAVFGDSDTVILTVDRNGPVTSVAWDPSGTVVVAETTADGGTRSLHRCNVITARCDMLDVGDVVVGRLVRGTPILPDADSFPGIWPEDTYATAELAVNAPGAEPWRFVPDLLVAQFAKAMLGWESPILGQPRNDSILPYSSSFEVEREPGGPMVNVLVSQVAGKTGWVVTGVSAPIMHFSSGYAAPNKIDFGFDRDGAATVDVVVRVQGVKYEDTAEHEDRVNFEIDGPLEHPAHYLILFRDQSGNVIKAISGQIAPKITRRPIG